MVSAKAFIIRSKLTAVREQSTKQLVEKLQTEFGIEAEFIDEYDTDDIDMEQIKKFVDLNKGGKSELFDSLIRNMHIRAVSNAMKHYTAVKKAAESDNDMTLVFEDDTLFGDNIGVKLKEVFDKTDHAWDICFIGLPSVAPIKDHSATLYEDAKASFKLLPSSDSYIISRAGAKRLFDAFLPIRFPTNIHYSYLAEVAPLDIKYIVPNLFVDGSKMGIYLSSLESNNRLYMNPEYNQLSQLVRKESLTAEDKQTVEGILEKIRFKNHPDIQLLNGIYHEKIGEFEKAKSLYNDAHSVMQQNGCVINNESEVLMKLINIQKHFQA